MVETDIHINKQLYEILVPVDMDGEKISVEYHREWDKMVRFISGGLTIAKPVRGQWVENLNFWDEEMIPIKIMCSEEQINTIADFTAKHYKQKAIMFFELSNKVTIKEY